MDHSSAPIAIIGIGCRLPGDIANPEQLWQFLVAGRNAWSEVPADRYNEAAFYHPNPGNNGTTNHRGGHFLNRSPAAFDANFFALSPLEAQALDPQHRLLLEVTYEALENAGISMDDARGTDTAVYVALFTHDHDRNIYKDPSNVPKFHITGSGDALASNRLSYIFDFKGPSMTLDTGCSGSLVALHQACQSLRAGESNMALASGVSMILSPDHMFAMSNLHMLNDDGRSYAFDTRGSGYGRGEGATTVLLKRLDDALKAGDHVRAVIRATAINQDGKTNGVTFPNQQAQQILASSVCRSAAIEAHEIPYVEAHGTGTAAGDQIELQAIASVFCSNGHRTKDLIVGSIKSNVGHLESASGLVGLLKTILVLEKGYIPPNADFQAEKQSLKLKTWGIRIPRELEPWPVSGDRRACVNSFGYGGTNAHVVLQSWPHSISGVDHPVTTSVDRSQLSNLCSTKAAETTLAHHEQTQALAHTPGDFKLMQLYVLTAKTCRSLLQVAARLKDWASERLQFDDYFDHLAYNLAVRRSKMQWRYSFVAGSHADFMASVRQDIRGKLTTKHRRIVFVFTGQGAHWVGMGQELLTTDNNYRKSLRKSDAILRKFGAPWSLIDEICSSTSRSRLHESEIAQPACTAIQIALVDYLAGTGVHPDMVLGHSSGEIGAAYAAGSLSHISALRISYCRSFLSSKCEQAIQRKGAMLMVALDELASTSVCAKAHRGIASIACVNSPSSTTISGDEAAIIEISTLLTQKGIFNRRLAVDTAYHSHHMQNVAKEYLCSLGTIEERAVRGDVQFISTVTAAIKTTDFSSEYWVSNLVSIVRFYDALQTCCRFQFDASTPAPSDSTCIFVEIGPHKVLGTPIRQTIKQNFESLSHEYYPSFVRGHNAVQSILELGGNLFNHGCSIDLSALNTLGSYRRQFHVLHDLPSYPWDYSQTYWHESRLSQEYRHRTHPSHDLLGVRMTSNTPLEPCWRYVINTDELPWLTDHVVDGQIIFPGAGYITMAIEAFRQIIGEMKNRPKYRYLYLRRIRFNKALAIQMAPSSTELQLCFRAQGTGKLFNYEFRVFAISQHQKWHEHCRGYIMTETDVQLDSSKGFDVSDHGPNNSRKSVARDRVSLAQGASRISSETIYSQLRSDGNLYGPTFATISELSMLDHCATCVMSIADIESVMPHKYQQPHMIHPTTLDALLHSALPLCAQTFGPGSIMPISIEKIMISSDISNVPGSHLTSAISLDACGVRSAQADISVFAGSQDAHEQDPVMKIDQLQLFGLKAPRESRVTSPAKNYYRIDWAPDIDYLCSQANAGPTCVSAAMFVDHLRFKQPQVDVLEIGAQTTLVDTFSSVFGGLEYEGVMAVPQITLTNRNYRELERSKAASQSRRPKIQLKPLDISHDPSSQGFQLDSFDVIVLPMSYVEKTATTALANVRSLLKPGGRLVLAGNAAYGRDEFEEILLRNKLGKLEFVLKDAKMGQNTGLIFGSKALVPDLRSMIPPIRIIAEESLRSSTDCIVMALEGMDSEISLVSWDSDFSSFIGTYIVLDSTQKPLLVDPTAERFKHIASLVGSSSAVIWINVEENSTLALHPARGLVAGFARSARAENMKLKLITIDVQDSLSDYLLSKSRVLKDLIIAFARDSSDGLPWMEAEYVCSNGQLLVPRLLHNEVMSDWLAREAKGLRLRTQPYLCSEYYTSLSTHVGSERESLWIAKDQLALQPLDPSVVEITTRAHFLDPSAMIEPTKVSSVASSRLQEFSGIVSAVGPSTDQQYQVGDRVCAWALSEELLASHIRVKPDNVSKLAESVSWSSAATIPIAFMTAYYVLLEIVNLQKGQWILVRGANSDNGKAAIQIAELIGASVLASVSTSAEKVELSMQLGIPAHRILLDAAISLPQAVLNATQNGGVDLIFNDTATDLIHELVSCVAPFGYFVHLLSSKGLDSDNLLAFQALQQITIISFDLATLMKQRPQKAVGLLGKVMSMIAYGDRVRHNPVTTVPISELHGPMQSALLGRPGGKIVLECDESTRIQVLDDRVERSSMLRKNATYVIAGGLGALGMKICRLMAGCGAQNILILSRRLLAAEEKQALENDLRLISTDLRIFTLPCDISESSAIDGVINTFRNLKLPPVRGVVQSATVLRDRILEQMTADDFQVPLQAKFLGTINLSRMFDTSLLDFFIMLSSLSGIVGSRGQANYAAANTFQDALANSKMTPRIKYLAIDLGMMVGSDAYNETEGRARAKNLLRQGWLPMSDEEFQDLLLYAFSREAYEDTYRQIITGFDGRSIHEAANPTAVLESAMFSHIRSSYVRKHDSKVQDTNGSWQLAVQAAVSMEDARRLIINGITQQLSNIIGLDRDRIPSGVPLLDLGLDSLLAIEVRNWILQEFDAQIQASEILDESSLVALAGKVSARSNLKNLTAMRGSETRAQKPNSISHSFSPESSTITKAHTLNNEHKATGKVQHLPIPDLSATLDLYIASARPFLGVQKIEHTATTVEQFRAGIGQQLQQRLFDRARNPQIGNWQYQLHVEGIYLKRRAPLHPHSTFYGVHVESSRAHDQAGRAALISEGAFAFKQRIEAGDLEQDYMNEEPLCMDSLQWLFNTNRLPGIGMDEICRYPEHDHAVALRRGHFFKINLTENGKPIPYSRLKAEYQAILDLSMERQPSVATLTADMRDTWTDLRSAIRSLGAANQGLLSMIETAAFVVCLDDGSPMTPSQRSNQFVLGDPGNRWSDKCLQFVVCENGTSGYICEHAMLDAASMRLLNKAVTHAIVNHQPGEQIEMHASGQQQIATAHQFNINAEIESSIARVEAHFKATYDLVESRHHAIPNLGKGLLHKHKISSRTGLQLIIQLASLMYFGKQHPSWETVTTMAFEQGRLDWIQAVSEPMAAFCRAAIDASVSDAEVRHLLRQAATTHTVTRTRVARGHGYAAHLEALREVLRHDEPVPAIFEDSTWEMMHVTNTRKLKTDASEGLEVQEGGFFMPDPESVFVHYELEEERSLLFVQSTEGRAAAFCEALVLATGKVLSLLGS